MLQQRQLYTPRYLWTSNKLKAALLFVRSQTLNCNNDTTNHSYYLIRFKVSFTSTSQECHFYRFLGTSFLLMMVLWNHYIVPFCRTSMNRCRICRQGNENNTYIMEIITLSRQCISIND